MQSFPQCYSEQELSRSRSELIRSGPVPCARYIVSCVCLIAWASQSEHSSADQPKVSLHYGTLSWKI